MIRLTPICLCSLLADTSSAAVTLVQQIDSFAAGPSPLVVTSGSQSQSYQAPSGTIPGDWRVLDIAITANPFSRDATVGVSSATGQYFAELGPGVAADLSLTYDGNQIGLGGFDLQSGGATSLGLLVADSDAGLEILVTVSDVNDQVATFQFQQSSAVTSDTLVEFPFASFTNSSATDFSQIDSLRFDFQNGVAGDFTFKMLGTYSTIPEPSTIFLSLVALTALSRRKR